jgi:hypothetical protein
LSHQRYILFYRLYLFARQQLLRLMKYNLLFCSNAPFEAQSSLNTAEPYGSSFA